MCGHLVGLRAGPQPRGPRLGRASTSPRSRNPQRAVPPHATCPRPKPSETGRRSGLPVTRSTGHPSRGPGALLATPPPTRRAVDISRRDPRLGTRRPATTVPRCPFAARRSAPQGGESGPQGPSSLTAALMWRRTRDPVSVSPRSRPAQRGRRRHRRRTPRMCHAAEGIRHVPRIAALNAGPLLVRQRSRRCGQRCGQSA